MKFIFGLGGTAETYASLEAAEGGGSGRAAGNGGDGFCFCFFRLLGGDVDFFVFGD